ncbi:MAG TPA: hypothetical protein PLB25_11995 [Rhodoferax sp.]|nr:hypothetical protein [Rhodoferax sp.]
MTRIALALSMATAMLAACSVNNGAPGDLREHLQTRGIKLQEIDSWAPISGRSGYILAAHHPATVVALVAAFGLQPVTEASHRQRCLASVPAKPVEVWQVANRPAALKLADGGQFEYLCVVIVPASQMYLVVEYAYG